MKRKKKAFIVLLIVVLAVVIVGTVMTTYAWFLSRYDRDYEFVLESNSHVIIKFETNLSYETGENVLTPATARRLDGTAQRDIAPFSVFDTTGAVVAVAASPATFSATGAFWTGEGEAPGLFLPEVRAYTSAFLTGRSITADNLISVLDSEAKAHPTASERTIARNDLVYRNEIEYFMIFEYLNTYFLYFDHTFYVVVGLESEADLVLPAAAESNDDFRYWKELSHTDRISYGTSRQVMDDTDTYFLLQPNTTFSFTLYVFVEKTDEELDPAINGETISVFATLKHYGVYEE